MTTALIYYCRPCQRRFRVDLPLCARVCKPTPTEQAEAAAWKAALRCPHCQSAEIEPFHYRDHDPEHLKRLRALDRCCEDNRSSYRADLARSRRGMVPAPEARRCPRCGEKVAEDPRKEKSCLACGGW